MANRGQRQAMIMQLRKFPLRESDAIQEIIATATEPKSIAFVRSLVEYFTPIEITLVLRSAKKSGLLSEPTP